MATVVTEHIGGWATDIVHLPVVAPEERQSLLLLVPGNPGVVDFYTSFLEQVHARSRGLEVLGVGHAGHTRRTAVDGTPFTLEQQVQHKLDVLAERYGGRGEVMPPIVLAGHSIGGWMCLQLAERLRRSPPAALAGARVLRVIGLCPTIMRMAVSPNGRLLTPLLSRPAVRGAAGSLLALLSRLPGALHRAAASAALMGQGGGAATVEASLQLVDPRCIGNLLAMAAQEMRDVNGREALAALAPAMRRLGPRLEMIFSTHDGWVPLEYVEELRRMLPRARLTVESDARVEHAFVLSRYASGEVAGRVVELLREPLLLLAAGTGLCCGDDDAEARVASFDVPVAVGRAYSADEWVTRLKGTVSRL